jgi:PKD repeat protein
VTEGGSSGSPIFNNSGRIVGDLTGGGSYCSTPTSPDLYGKFSYSWDQNGSTAAERLKDWLDPDNTGITTLDGAYCGGSTTITADFVANLTAIPVGGTVDFTDLTSGTPTSWSWTFTGGTPGTSTTQNPAGIQYNTAGTYTVSLTASDGTSTDTETKVNYIVVGDPPPVANFVANTTNIPVGGSVDFTDLSTGAPTSWSWTFSGGVPATSTAQNPSGIVYNTAGAYTVSLTATNGNGSDIETKTNYIIVGGTIPGDETCDTMNYPLPGHEVMYSVLYQNGVYGYMSGNNGYSDMAKANFFVPASPYIKLTGAYLKFGKARKRPTANAEIIFAVWDNTGPGGCPGSTPLATDTLLMSTIVSQVNSHNMTLIQFQPPINITSAFYLGVYLPTIGGDTLALLTNKNGETYPGTAWEQWQSGTWYRYSDSLSWGYNLSHAIFPIMCKQDYGIADNLVSDDITLYPNPANESVTVDFGLLTFPHFEIQMFDVVGQLCRTYNYSGDPISRYAADLSGLRSGIYFLNINTGGSTVSKKISLIK